MAHDKKRMTKAWCIWCETGKETINYDYFWIHKHCFEDMSCTSKDIKFVEKIVLGQPQEDSVVAFLKRVEDFERRRKYIEKHIQQLKGDEK